MRKKIEVMAKRNMKKKAFSCCSVQVFHDPACSVCKEIHNCNHLCIPEMSQPGVFFSGAEILILQCRGWLDTPIPKNNTEHFSTVLCLLCKSA